MRGSALCLLIRFGRRIKVRYNIQGLLENDGLCDDQASKNSGNGTPVETYKTLRTVGKKQRSAEVH